jgi:iron complex outermembrane receptor protein
MLNSRTTLLGAAIAMALLKPTSPAYAADQAAAENLDEVVVTGIRSSIRKSMETKRAATGVIEALTSEDVGKFPDKNLAEALQRVPGIVISRDFGDGERVNLRGTSATLTRTILNGHSLATADWFILDQLNSTRSFNYLMLPADVIGQVEVLKSPQADYEEGGIGGTINVKTRHPLDLESMSGAVSAQAAYSELSDKFDPNVSALFNYKNDDSTFGIMVAGKYEKRQIRRDGVEVLGYQEIDNDPSAAVNTILFPSLIGSALFTQERVRKSFNFEAQWKASEALEFQLAGLYSKFDADNTNENYLAWGSRAINNGGTLTNTTIVGDTAVAGTISSLNNGTSDFGAVYDAINRFAAADTKNVDLLTSYQINDAWKAELRIGTTEASGNTDSQPFVEFGAPATYTYDLRGKSPQVNFLNVDPTDPNDMQFIFSSLHQILNDDSEDYGYLDFTDALDVGVLKSIKFGAKFSDHDRDLRFNATTYGGFHVPINTTPASAFAGGPTPSDFLDNISAPGTLDAYWQIDKNAVNEILFNNLASGPGRVLYPQQSFSVGEKATAGYIMGNLQGESWRGNVGVRYVQTKQTSDGYVTSPLGSISNPFSNYDPISVEHTYSDVLPSASFAFDVSPQVVIRVAAGKVMARPDYTDVAPRLSLNPGSLTGTGGNPNLDPYRASQADVSAEWYPDPDSFFALAIYYKDIKSFITDAPGTENVQVQSATSPSLSCTAGPDPNTFICPFTINRRSNGGGGEIKGAELSFNKALGSGFGFTGNYTYSDASADNGDPIPGNSKRTWNLAAYFENPTFSTRLAYTYRSDFFVTFDRSTQLNQKALTELDASFAWNVTPTIAATFDAINITDEKIEQYAGDTFRPRAIYDNGRVFYAGVRFKF